MLWKLEIDGVEYEFRRKARYIDGYRYCSNCCWWVKRRDGRSLFRCPVCNVRLRAGLRKRKNRRDKSYITVSNIANG